MGPSWGLSDWRELGAPWGGLLTTAADYSSFIQSFLYSGAVLAGAGGRVLGPLWASQMVTDQVCSRQPLLWPLVMTPPRAPQQAVSKIICDIYLFTSSIRKI